MPDGNDILIRSATAIVAEAERRQIMTRLLGGVAILLHSPDALAQGGYRVINDIDLLTTADHRRQLAQLLTEMGYEPEPRFNALNGHRRMVFHGSQSDVDVLLGRFEMCHTFQVSDRLALDSPTLPVSDLLMTKLQIVKLNEKDALDIMCILREHPVGQGPGDRVDVDRIQELVRVDWGLWRTASATLHTVSAISDSSLIRERIAQIQQAMTAVPKSAKWKFRARIGDRLQWYVLPDEVVQ